MSITITNTTSTIEIYSGSDLIRSMDKDSLVIKKVSDLRISFIQNNGVATLINYDDITAPASADIDALMVILAGYQNASTKPVTIQDSSGNSINAVTNAEGNYHLRVSAIQSIITSTGNSTTDNLTAGSTFEGTAEETYGISAIQTYLFCDQNCTFYVDQGVDGTNWDIIDEITCLANNAITRIIYSVAPYFRIRITNNGSSTTSILRAAAGMTPIITPLPRALTDDQRLKVETTITGRHNTERHAWINPTNEQAVSPVYRMVGTNFDGDTKDTNFWTELVDAGTDGTVTQGGGEIEMKTSATATGWAKYTSVRKSRFVAGSAQLFSGAFNFKTAATADNIRRVGVYTTTDTVNTPVDGFYFELNNATFSVNSRADGGTVSSVASGSFNGEYGVSWTPTADTYYKLSIEWSPMGAFFYVNGKLLHKKQGAHQSHFMTLPITMENIYTSGAVDVNFETVGMYIARQGELHTNPTSTYLTTGTHILKYGAGILTKIIVGDNVSGSVTVYDNTAASGTLLTVLDTAVGSSPLGAMDYNVPFNDGLTIVIVGTNKITVVYE